LILGPRRQVRNVSARLSREGDRWQSARIDARFVNGHELSLRFGSESEKRGLSFLSDDLGATLSLLDVTENIVGGRVAITGQVSDTAGKRVLRGHVDGDNYNLMRAPGLAKVLSLTSLNAIAACLPDRVSPSARCAVISPTARTVSSSKISSPMVERWA
jgi:hypothetical protein